MACMFVLDGAFAGLGILMCGRAPHEDGTDERVTPVRWRSQSVNRPRWGLGTEHPRSASSTVDR